MNNFKKILSLFFFVLFAFTLVACGPSGEVKAKLEEQADKIYLGDLSEVTNDLKLPKYAFGDKAFTVEWASDNEKVIEIKELDELYYLGFVTMQNDVTVVKLTATVTYEKATTTREFEVTVLADEYVGYENIAAVKAQEGKEKDVSKVKFSGTVCFTTGSGFGVYDGSAAMYCYGSNHGRTVGEKVEVRGVWTFYNNMVQLKESNVKVLGTDDAFNIEGIAEEKSISEIAALEAKSVDPENSTKIFKTKFAAKENATGSYNTYKLVDPLDSNKIVDVSKYNDADTLTYVGELAASGKFYEGIVIIYCSRSGTNGLWDVLLVPSTVKEVSITLSDDQKVSAVANELKDSFDGKTVKESLTLPTTHANGATITWASSAEDVISAAGVYVAPAAMTDVKLTATIKVGELTETVEITVKAAAKQTSIIKYVTEVEVGKPYKLGLVQEKLEKTLFATGKLSGSYGETTEDYASAAEVYLETAEGGYYVYFKNGETKTYISASSYTKDDGKVSYSLVYGEKSTVWTFDTEHYTLKANVDGTDVYFGTYNTFNTISVSKFSYVATSYPCRFYVEVPQEPVYVKTVEVGKPYKLGLVQEKLEKTLFATGKLSGSYGETTEDYASAAEVYLETAEGGYYVYFKNGETKTYISASSYTKDDGKVSYSLVYGEKSTVWTFDTEHYTLKANVDGTDVYFGTYNTFNTISVSKFSYVATSYPCRFYTSNGTTGGNETNTEEKLEGATTLDFVTKFAEYAAEWSEAYGEVQVVSSALGVDTKMTIDFSRADKQRAGNTIDDRPVIAANSGTEYVTVTLETGSISKVQFDLKQWTTKTFDAIYVEYFDGTNWVKCSSEITTPGLITSSELADGVTQVRLAVTTSNSKNVQVGLNAISLVLK